MVDADGGRGKVTIAGNRVAGAECGDGIDLRMSGDADYTARVRGNEVADLRQGEELESVLAFGLQTRDGSRLAARLFAQQPGEPRQRGGAGAGPAGADTEGVFVNPVDGSELHARVARNEYTNANGLGGFSGNGLEYVTMGDGSRSSVVVRNSTFTESTGDVIEQLGLGTNAEMRLELENVVARDSRGFGGSGFGNTVLIPGNNADCLLAASGGAGNVIETTVRGGELTGCANNGITFGSAVANGSGPTAAMNLDVSGTKITGNRGANLRIGNETGLGSLAVRVEDTDLSDARAPAPASRTCRSRSSARRTQSTIELSGGNCLDGGTLAAFVNGYDVSATGDWWGQAGGPRPGQTVVAGGALATAPALDAAPARC